MEFHCPHCRAITPATGKFCQECAYDLRKPKTTPPKDLSFDEKLTKIQRYLPKGLTEKILSRRDRIEGERKHVTVMFCDMEGFTPLSELLGIEEAYAIMDQVYEILIHKVHDYEGTVNEMTGDGIMALFGAPVALEDAPQRAIRSSLAIHREMAKFSDQLKQEKKDALPVKMRIGIHTGPVVVGTVGNDLRVEFKAVGDTVNLASRMEGQAQPGTTYITEDTFKLTEGLFRFEGLGQRVIKGKEEPINVYRAIAPSTRRTRFDVSQELLSHLSVLKDSELLYERGIYPQSTFIFKHALTQEVVYDSLLLKRKKEIHEEIGRAMEALYPDRLEEHYELLAYHNGCSANADKAVKYLDLANQKAAKLNAMEEAKAYFDEAMALLDALPETEENRQRRIALLVKQGIVFFLLLRHPEYYDLLTCYEPTAKALGNPELLGAFYARLGYCEFSFGNYDQAIQTLTKAAELAEASGNVEEAGYAYVFLAFSHFDRGDYDRVLAIKEDVLRTMAHQFNLRFHTYALSLASRAFACLGRWDEAVEEGQKALSVAEEFSDNSLISWSASNLSIAYTWRGDLARAVECGELAVQKAPTPVDKSFAQRSFGRVA
jgi:class 3 adenylate cyclase